jgi:hypothetical protein
MNDPLIIYAYVIVLLSVSGGAVLYWQARTTRTDAAAEREAAQRTRQIVEKPAFLALFMALVVLSSLTVAQDAVRLIPGYSESSLRSTVDSLPLLKYIFALGLGLITLLSGIIGKRAPTDPQGVSSR